MDANHLKRGMNTVTFTCRADHILHQLKTNDVHVEDTSTDVPNAEHRFVALWDTGASATGITKRVAQMLNLQPIRTEENKTVGIPETVNVYLANVFISDRYCAENLEVHDISEGNGFDVLIGMDIISRGDLCINNYEGKTVWSFRIPSNGIIDFQKQKDLQKVIQPKHGQGKRKRK